jgi:hypothetical protein
MKAVTTYTIERDDPQALQPEKAMEAVNLLREHFHELATDKAQKAVSRIRGNSFTSEDVFCYNQTINEVGLKTIESCARMRAELSEDQEKEPRNKHFIEGIQSTVALAVQISNEFVKAFHLQKASEDFKRCREDYLRENAQGRELGDPDS